MVKEWKDHIYTSEDGTLPLYTYKGTKDSETYHLVIPGCANPNYSQAPSVLYSDIGIRKDENGHWQSQVDISGLPNELKNFKGKLAAAIAITKVKKIANSSKRKQTKDFMRGKKRCIRLIAPVEEKYRIKI